MVAKNHAAVDLSLKGCTKVKVPEMATATRGRPPPVPSNAPDFVRTVTAEMMAGRGDPLPVSALRWTEAIRRGTAAF